LLLVSVFSCEEARHDTGDIAQRDTLPGSWVTWSPYKWDHDGYPLTGKYCKLYSDRVMREKRPELLEFCENTFARIMKEFQFTEDNLFSFPPGYSNIHIFLYLDKEPAIAAAFWGSVLIRVESETPDTSRLAYLLKHELTHAFEYLIEGKPELGTDVWFREGLAVFCGSNGSWNHLSTADDLEDWIVKNKESANRGNPISIHAWEDFPEGSDITGYYTVFDIVIKYILDENGMGKSLDDFLNLFFDIRNDKTFSKAFETNFSVQLEVFEDEIFYNMKKWLSLDSL
jgi:hypothetical protein